MKILRKAVKFGPAKDKDKNIQGDESFLKYLEFEAHHLDFTSNPIKKVLHIKKSTMMLFFTHDRPTAKQTSLVSWKH